MRVLFYSQLPRMGSFNKTQKLQNLEKKVPTLHNLRLVSCLDERSSCGGNRNNKVKSVEISSIFDGGYFTGMGELKDTSYKLSTPSSHQKLKRCRPIYQVITYPVVMAW